MKKLTLLLSSIFLYLTCISQGTNNNFSSFQRAKQHPIVHEGPAPDFFEGALIGNGGLGAVVCTRPDAVVIRFGHNNVWDIRIAEDNKALPVNRVYFHYSHFHNAVRLQRTVMGTGQFRNSLSLDSYVIGVERVFDQGDSSVEVRMPFGG